MTTASTVIRSAAPAFMMPSLGMGKLGRLLEAWRRRARVRRALLAADPRMLADLGISRAQANFLALECRLD